jgi:hypothetical protein
MAKQDVGGVREGLELALWHADGPDAVVTIGPRGAPGSLSFSLEE